MTPPDTRLERLAAIQRAGIDRDTAIAVLRELGDDVDGIPPEWRLEVLLAGAELGAVIEHRLAGAAADVPLARTAATELDLEEATDYQVTPGESGRLGLRYVLEADTATDAFGQVGGLIAGSIDRLRGGWTGGLDTGAILAGLTAFTVSAYRGG